VTKAARKAAPQDAAPAANTERPVVRSALPDIGQCYVLPLAAPDANFDPVEFEPRSIQRFADRDGTTMIVVAVDGALHKTPAPPKELA